MINISKKVKIALISLGTVVIVCGAVLGTYLKVLPAVVSNKSFINFVERNINKFTSLELVIKNPKLTTELSPVISFKVDEMLLFNNKESLLAVENFDTTISFKEIFKKNIIIKKLGADYIFADINNLTKLAFPQTEKKEQKPSDWNIDLFDSFLYVKKSLFLYKVEPKTYVSLKADDLELDNNQKDVKHLHFNITADIAKDGKNTHFNIADRNAVYTQNKTLYIKNCYLSMNKSKIFFNAEASRKIGYILEIFTDKIDVSDVLDLIDSDIVENNLDQPLAFFNDLKGSFNFKITLTKNDLNGIVNLNKISCKIVPLSNIPVMLDKGKIVMTKNDITLKDFDGYYNYRKENKIEMEGTVKDYLKTMDTNVIAKAAVTNDFVKNYFSKMVGIPVELTGGSTKTRVDIKSINNKIDLAWYFGLKAGQDILIDGASLTPNKFIRGLKGDIHFEDNLLSIKSVDYYIVPDSFSIEQKKNAKPVVKVFGNIDCGKPVPDVKNIGFEIPNPLPSEFLNVLIGQKLFKGGKIAGIMEYNNTAKYPALKGYLAMDDVRIPSQRVYLKHGEMSTQNGLLKLAAEGKYRRSSYDFSGSLINEIKFPVVVKDVNLTVDDVDIEKFLLSANNQSSKEITDTKFDVTASGEAKDDDDNTPTFDIGNFIVENCVLHILNGKYKDIVFKDVKATLSLDKHSVLNMYSNRFEIAEGHSSAKINCDLKKHLYSLVLGIKDVNSDVIATTLLALPREITGKASGIIALNTDDSLKMNGFIKFDIKDGTIQKVGLVEYILKFAALFRNPLAMISPSTFGDLVNIPEGNFDKINGFLELKDNNVEKMMIKSSAPQLSSFIVGRYELESGDASLRIYTKFSNNNKGFAGFLRNISLNSLANRIPLSARNDSNYYAAEISQLPPIEAEEKDCQIFLTKVDGDVQHNNFISSLKKIQ